MIKQLQSIDEYKSLIEEFKKICRVPFSNIYLMPSAIDRYIKLQRAYFEKSEYGVVFYFDEGTYYRVYLYVDGKQKFQISAFDKKMLVRNTYNMKYKNEDLLHVQNRLQEIGFTQEGTSVQIQGKTQELLSNCMSIGKYTALMEKRGYHCIQPDFSRFGQIEQVIIHSEILKDYHLTFRTEQEKKELEEGSYLCIVNKDNEICAASIAVINFGIAQAEVMAVKEEYKMKGLAPILTYQRLKWLCDRNVSKIQGWILLHNETSLRYHQKIGYQLIDRYAEDWILEV